MLKVIDFSKMDCFKNLKIKMGLYLPEEIKPVTKTTSSTSFSTSYTSTSSYTSTTTHTTSTVSTSSKKKYNSYNYNNSYKSKKSYNNNKKLYYAYGTYAMNGKLYTMEDKEIKNKNAYYEECRRNKTLTTRTTYTSKGITYEYAENRKPYSYYFNNKNSKRSSKKKY